MRTSSATNGARVVDDATTRRGVFTGSNYILIHAKCLFPRSVCHCSSLMARQTEASEERSGGGSNEKEKPREFRVLRRRRRAARRRSSSCVLETPLAFFWPSTSMTRVFKQSAKSVNAPPKPKPKTDSNRIKPLFWPNARFPRKRRGTCTRASPAARLGFGRKGTPPALSARASAVRAKARLADGRARPRVPGIREIRRVADFPTRIVASRAASRHPSARCSTLSTSLPSAALWGRSGSPRTWTEG